MSNIYLYDGSFSSLIYLIEYLIINKKQVLDIKSIDNYVNNLLDEPIFLKLDKNKHSQIYKYIPQNISWRIKYVFLANINKELVIYEFIKNYYVYKDTVLYRRNISCVNELINISSKVSKEIHHIKGFLRFKKMINFYYAEISPTYNIISLIVNHFIKRLPKECFVIKDNIRSFYAVYDTKKVIFLKESDICNLNLYLHKDEKECEDLWKTFFKTISIKERENLKNQMKFMPKKYWKDIIEMSDKVEKSDNGS